MALTVAVAWGGPAEAGHARGRPVPPRPQPVARTPIQSLFSRPPPPPNDGIIHWNTPNADGNLGGPGMGGGGGGGG